MMLRAMVDKVRNMFGQTPVVELQHLQDLKKVQTETIADWEQYKQSSGEDSEILKTLTVGDPFDPELYVPQKIKLYNVYLHQRKNKSQKKNWKKYKGQRAAK